MLERIRIARRDGRTGVRQTTESLFEVELLERRQMLAGNVQVFVTTGGDLVINGDSQDNVGWRFIQCARCALHRHRIG